MRDNTYITIQSWMRTELNLSGNELLVYAIIFGFSQDDNSKFTGSRQYLADWCGCTVRSVQNVLNTLVTKKYIAKTEKTVNGVRVCEYVANFTGGENFSRGDENFSLNNIADNIEDIEIINDFNNEVSDVEAHSYSKEDMKAEFLGSAPKRQKKHRTSLYDKCLNEIFTYTHNGALIDVLTKYLSVRLAIKEKPIYGVNQWIGLLNRLSKTDGDKVAIVEQSIEKGWCSFYPIKSQSSSAPEGDGVYCDSSDTTEEERAESLRQRGKREKF